MQRPYLDRLPDKRGYFGRFGGSFIPPQLEKAFEEITEAYEKLSRSFEYLEELKKFANTSRGANAYILLP